MVDRKGIAAVMAGRYCRPSLIQEHGPVVRLGTCGAVRRHGANILCTTRLHWSGSPQAKLHRTAFHHGEVVDDIIQEMHCPPPPKDPLSGALGHHKLVGDCHFTPPPSLASTFCSNFDLRECFIRKQHSKKNNPATLLSEGLKHIAPIDIFHPYGIGKAIGKRRGVHIQFRRVLCPH